MLHTVSIYSPLTDRLAVDLRVPTDGRDMADYCVIEPRKSVFCQSALIQSEQFARVDRYRVLMLIPVVAKVGTLTGCVRVLCKQANPSLRCLLS